MVLCCGLELVWLCWVLFVLLFTVDLLFGLR